MRLALCPESNPRLFLAGGAASLDAAASWVGGTAADCGARHLLCTFGSDPSALDALLLAEELGLYIQRRGRRFWLSGSANDLWRCGALVPGAGELAAAVDAFEDRLHVRPALVMGILNVTPDSFSDGGLWVDLPRAVDRALEMIEEGADVLDIGGESTRPGAAEVPAAEELRRVLPVLERLRPRTSVRISIDTRRASVARACLEAGADWINDVSGLTHDPEMAETVARFPEACLVLMHSRARPADERYSTEYDAAVSPVYEDVVAEVLEFLRWRAQAAIAAGITPENLWIDPGFGFGKTYAQNVDLLARLREFTSTGIPILIGTSRKSTVGKLVGDLPPAERLEGSLATAVMAVERGAAAVRVHDVQATSRAVRAVAALRRDAP
jgi:dihydropteroate synthase